MILALYKRLKEVGQTEYGDIVLGSEVIKSSTGRARKLRLALIDDTYVDVWYSEDRHYSLSLGTSRKTGLCLST